MTWVIRCRPPTMRYWWTNRHSDLTTNPRLALTFRTKTAAFIARNAVCSSVCCKVYRRK